MVYAIGDVHGQLSMLHRLLQKIEPTSDDRCVFLGDYVDRGPEVADTIEFLCRFREQHPQTIFLRGNHDQGMMNARDVVDRDRSTELTYSDVDWWFMYGGQETINSYGAGNWYRNVPEHHWAFLEATTLEAQLGYYRFVHAGFLPPGKKWFEKEDPRMWIREDFILSDHDFGAAVIYGHTPTRDHVPRIGFNKVGVDTGAAYFGRLTALVIDPEVPYDPDAVKFIQV